MWMMGMRMRNALQSAETLKCCGRVVPRDVTRCHFRCGVYILSCGDFSSLQMPRRPSANSRDRMQWELYSINKRPMVQ